MGTSRAQQMPCHMLPAFSHSLAGWLFLEVPKEKNGKGRCPPPTWAASLATPHHSGGEGGSAAEISGCHLRWCPLPPKFHSVCGLSMDGTNASGEAVGKIQAFSELSRAGTGWGQGVSLLHSQRTAWRLLSRGGEPPCPASSLLKPGLTCHPRDLGTPSMLQARHPSTSQMDPPQIRRCL